MRKNRYYFYVLLILSGTLLLFLPASYVFNYYRDDDSILVKAFETSGAEIVETNVNVYSSGQGMFLKREEIISVVKSLASEMEIDYGRNEKVENYDEGYNQLSLIGQNSRGQNVVIIVSSMDFTKVEDSGGGCETDIVLDISSNGKYENLPSIERKAKRAINNFIKGARVTSCIIGRYEDDIPENRKEEIINSILESIGATEVERTIYDGMVSVSAHTPGVQEYIELGQKKINFNIAMRYNSYEGKTYIWLGSPVISVEY